MEWAMAIGALSIAAGAVTGATTGIVGAVEQHKQAQANADAQEAQALYNQRLQEREASRIEQANQENARRQREASEQLMARQRALLGASGVAMTAGSPLAILGQTAADEELKVQDIHAYGAAEANKSREAAKMYGFQAGVARMSAPTGTMLGASIAGNIGSGIAGLGQAAFSYGSGMSKVSKGSSGGSSIPSYDFFRR